MSDTQTEIKNLFAEASEQTQRLFREVVEIEKSKLHMSKPHGVIETIVDTVKVVVK